MAEDRPNVDGARNDLGWSYLRRSMVVPIAAIMIVAIACVMVAVFSSAQRANDAALANQRELFTQALTNLGRRMLRDVTAVASSDAAYHRIRVSFDPDWVQTSVGLPLQTFFRHDFVFVADQSSQIVYASFGRRSVDPNWFNSVRSELQPVLDKLRGGTDSIRAISIAEIHDDGHRISLLQSFLGHPAIVAAIAITARDATPDAPDTDAPAVISVKLLDDEALGAIAARLQMINLHNVADQPPGPNDYVLDLADQHDRSIASFAWTPGRPGAEIVRDATPFFAIALGGFVVLAGLILRYMRKTATAIAVGESRLRHLALHDPLCGLPNRIYFSERLEAVIARVKGGAPPAAVFYIDLDHFKDVNDTLGHPIGDDLIRSVTQRLTQTLRGNDLVARLGGDEFAVITSAGHDHVTSEAIGARISASLCAPYCINNQTIVIGASIGIAIIDQNIGAASDVMRHADMALYRAKNEGRNRACIYDTAMDDSVLRRKLVENKLRAAIDNGELWLAYQPIVNSSGEKVVGVEALARWRHPERGEIPPSEFIPIAEDSGLIIALGEFVLRQACLDAKTWPDITLSVNVSPLQFRRPDFVDMVERIIRETGFDPLRLELEVTESTLLGNVDTAELAMFRLKALGVRLALDDFGTGYSSLLYLRRFPFDRLKIDRSFVHSIEKAADAAAIVQAVASLGRGLGMKVTAEGVETAEQHLFLRAAGVHMMQGYRFGRPGTATEMGARLAAPGSFRVSDDPSLLALAG